MFLEGGADFLLLRVLQVKHPGPESAGENGAAVLLYLPTSSLLIEEALPKVPLDFLLRLQDVNVLTRTLGSGLQETSIFGNQL